MIAEAVRNGFMICHPVVDALIAQLNERKLDVLIIDPFVSCHRVTENDNNAIDAVTKAWARVADAANCAVELVHRVRKGEQEVTVESARGGGSSSAALSALPCLPCSCCRRSTSCLDASGRRKWSTSNSHGGQQNDRASSNGPSGGAAEPCRP